MLDQLLDLVKQNAGDTIINNPAIPNERNHEAIQEVSSSMAGSLQDIFSGGGIKDILKLFGGGDVQNNTVTNYISGGLIQNLMDKFNLDHGSAGNIADRLVPNVMQNLVSKTNDPNDSSIDIQGIFNSLSGGNTSGFNVQGLLNKFKGGSLDLDGDGDTDFQDLMQVVGGNGGGVLDKIKGMFN